MNAPIASSFLKANEIQGGNKDLGWIYAANAVTEGNPVGQQHTPPPPLQHNTSMYLRQPEGGTTKVR